MNYIDTLTAQLTKYAEERNAHTVKLTEIDVNKDLSDIGKKKLIDAENERFREVAAAAQENWNKTFDSFTATKEDKPADSASRLYALTFIQSMGANITDDLLKSVLKPLEKDVSTLKQLHAVMLNIPGDMSHIAPSVWERLTAIVSLDAAVHDARVMSEKVFDPDANTFTFGVTRSMLQQKLTAINDAKEKAAEQWEE